MTAVTVLIVNFNDIASHHLTHLHNNGYRTINTTSDDSSFQGNPDVDMPDIALVSLLSLMGDINVDTKNIIEKLSEIPTIYIIQPYLMKTLEQFAKPGDDFVVDPFLTEELMTRMQIALSRTDEKKYDDFAKIIVDENLAINFMRQIIIKGNQVIKLSPKELKLLRFLVQNNGKIIPQEILIKQLWSGNKGDEGKLRVHISRLRKKLELDPHYPYYLQTEYGYGYRFLAIHPDKKDNTDLG